MARLYIKTPWSYETDSWFDVTSINFNSQKVHEDKIFERQDILQFLSQGSKYYKYVKSPNHDIGTLSERIIIIPLVHFFKSVFPGVYHSSVFFTVWHRYFSLEYF